MCFVVQYMDRLLPIIKIMALNADCVKTKKIEIWKQIQKENEVKRDRRIEHSFTKYFTKDATTILTSLLKIV